MPETSATGYKKHHRRLARIRGKASEHKCILCGKRAAQWAYDHLDHDQIDTPNGPYSQQLERYHPMCGSCHRSVDLSRLRHILGTGWESDVCPPADRVVGDGPEPTAWPPSVARADRY